MTLALAESENVGGLHAAIADRLAAEDDARREWLNAMVKGGGRCRYCGAKVSDKALDRAPGVCAHPNCQRKGRRDAVKAQKLNHNDVPETPAEGAEMPKGRRNEPTPCCGTYTVTHKKGCERAEQPKQATAVPTSIPQLRSEKRKPVARVARLRPAGESRPSRAASDANVDAMTIPELVELRGLIDGELARRRGELEEQLAAVRKAIGVAA